VYGPGKHFIAWHCDSYDGGHDFEDGRMLTVIIMLTDRKAYTGGALEVKQEVPGKRKLSVRRVSLDAGDAVIFPARKLWHRVNRVKSGTRKTLVSWVYDKRWPNRDKTLPASHALDLCWQGAKYRIITSVWRLCSLCVFCCSKSGEINWRQCTGLSGCEGSIQQTNLSLIGVNNIELTALLCWIVLLCRQFILPANAVPIWLRTGRNCSTRLSSYRMLFQAILRLSFSSSQHSIVSGLIFCSGIVILTPDNVSSR